MAAKLTTGDGGEREGEGVTIITFQDGTHIPDCPCLECEMKERTQHSQGAIDGDFGFDGTNEPE